MNHVDTMIYLSQLELDCSETQSLIDTGRMLNPNSQAWQLELDRKQTEVNEKLEKIIRARKAIIATN